MSTLGCLLYGGDYSHILLAILKQVTVNDLASLQRVNRDWREFIQERVWGDKLVVTKMRKVWGSYMPTSSIKSNKVKVLCMQCDEKYLICGEAGTGQIVIYSRPDFNFSWEGYMRKNVGDEAPGQCS